MKSIEIENKAIGSKNPVFIIAEAGVNHNGNLAMAKKLVRMAKSCGADCVKFQTYKAERIVTVDSPKAAYQLKTTDPVESQLEMLKKLELTEDEYSELVTTCKEAELIFLSTPYNIEDIDFLDHLGVPAFKVASGQAVEPYFLEYMAKKMKPIILSTGMCTLGEVEQAVLTIRNTGNEQLVLLQCNTNYPSLIEDTNLRAMLTMQESFDVNVGYSDHTTTLLPAIAATALGATIIEKHFTLDKTLPGPDQSSSSDPEEFSLLVQSIRDVERSLGDGLKKPTDAESVNAQAMRRSIVAGKDIKAGTVFTMDNLKLKRPGNGILANNIETILGRAANVDISADTIINLGMVQW